MFKLQEKMLKIFKFEGLGLRLQDFNVTYLEIIILTDFIAMSIQLVSNYKLDDLSLNSPGQTSTIIIELLFIIIEKPTRNILKKNDENSFMQLNFYKLIGINKDAGIIPFK